MNVFISYSREDITVVSPLVALMRCTGTEVFLDIDSIDYGANWKIALNQAISRCERMIVIWSISASESVWVMREFLEAKDQDKSIVPVMIDQTPLPSALADIQACNELLPLISAFKESVNKNHASPARLMEEEMGAARQMTARLFQPEPNHGKTGASSIREKLKRIRRPRVVINYDVDSLRSHDVDPDSRRIAESAVRVIQAFEAIPPVG